MSCEHPYVAYYTGNKTSTGKDELIICCDENESFLNVDLAKKRGFVIDCHNREFVDHVNGYYYLTKFMRIPCGKCLSCRMDKAQEWATRLSLESLYFKNAYFITLTYNDSFVGDYCLKKRDAQKFLMRLQKAHPHSKYFLCGEYGTKTLRPHYHLIFFTDDDLVLGDKLGANRWLSPEISRLWSIYDRKKRVSIELGLIEVSMANPACMGYVAQYCQDKQSKDDPLGRPPKFRLMSRGLGFRSCEEQYDIFVNDPNCYAPGGNVAPWPKSLVRHIDSDLLKEKRRDMALSSQFNYIAEYLTANKCEAGYIKRKLKENELNKHKRSNI